MKKIFTDLVDSFRISETGFSSRKLTAFVIVVLVIIIHAKWLMLGNLSQLEMVLTIDYAFISALFGMTTFQSLKTFGKDTTEDKATEPEKEPEVK
jgi:hypothetical protein